MQKIDLKDYVKNNSFFIYQYINTEILKDIGELNPNYFIKLIEDIFVKNNEFDIKKSEISTSLFPYYIFTLIFGKGKMDYTSLRVETLNLNKLNKQISVYYNYARFSLNDGFLDIDLMQTKFGGMPIDKDVLKHSKKIGIKPNGLEEFISSNQNLIEENEGLKLIKTRIEEILD